MIVLNSLRDAGAGFGGDTNRITIFSRDGRNNFPLESKRGAAIHIVDKISLLLF
jgi:phosphopantothenoylcysteine decarboxylase/phosphopantothenate--cysteine ligase